MDLQPSTSGKDPASQTPWVHLCQQDIWTLCWGKTPPGYLLAFQRAQAYAAILQCGWEIKACGWIPIAGRGKLWVLHGQFAAPNSCPCPSLGPAKGGCRLEIGPCFIILHPAWEDLAQRSRQPDWLWQISYALLHPLTACFSHQPCCHSFQTEGVIASLCKA